MRRIVSAIIISGVFIGCGQEAKPSLANSFADDDTFIVDENLNKTSGIRIHDNNGNFYNGPYPKSLKDKTLGNGLLNREFSRIKKYVLDNLIEDKNSIKISIKFKGKIKNKKLITQGFLNYFSAQNGKFITIFDGPSDVKVYVSQKNGILGFKVVLSNTNIFDLVEPLQFTTPKSIQKMQAESLSNWSTIKIKTNDGSYVTYSIMKNPIKVEEFYPNKLTKQDRAVTYITFDQADDYCFKKYGGSVASLYVFEHALREGKINPPTKFYATAEFVAAFDPASKEDTRLKMPDDVVSLKIDECENKKDKSKKDQCYADSDYSSVLEFDYTSNQYKNIEDTYKAENLTFRCIKKGVK